MFCHFWLSFKPKSSPFSQFSIYLGVPQISNRFLDIGYAQSDCGVFQSYMLSHGINRRFVIFVGAEPLSK
jgi:hypothetical protein